MIVMQNHGGNEDREEFMLNELNKNHKKIIIIILALLLLVLLFIGYNNYKNYSNKKEESNKKILYDNYSYTLPSNWEYQEEYEENDIEKMNIYSIIPGENNTKGLIAVVHTVNYEKSGYTKDELFSKTSIIESILNKNEIKYISNGKLINYQKKKVIVFQYVTEEDSAKKFLLAYMYAYDNKIYVIRLSSSKLENNESSMYFDYDSLEQVLDILNTAKKNK